jgi:hypothetical protein
MKIILEKDVDRREMTHIRPLVGSPTVTDWNLTSVRYGRTMRAMQISEFHCWGFLIVRTASYSDENNQLWESFLSRMRSANEDTMTGQQWNMPEDIPALLLPLLRWDVLEDRDALDGASVDGARQRFDAWRDEVSVERDGEGANGLKVRLAHMPRFRYFVMVDDESLASMVEADREEASRVSQSVKKRLPIKVRVVDAGRPQGVEHLYGFPGLGNGQAVEEDAEDAGDESDESMEESDEDLSNTHTPVEGCTDWDVGWMWVSTKFLLSFYDTIQAESGWDCFYERPPKIY